MFNKAFKYYYYYYYIFTLISSRQLSLSALSLPCIVVSVFWSGLSASPPTAAAAATTAAADFAEPEEVHAKCAAASRPPAGTLSTQDVSPPGLFLLEAHGFLKPISAAGQDHGFATATKAAAAAGWGFRRQLQTFPLPPRWGWWRRS